MSKPYKSPTSQSLRREIGERGRNEEAAQVVFQAVNTLGDAIMMATHHHTFVHTRRRRDTKREPL